MGVWLLLPTIKHLRLLMVTTNLLLETLRFKFIVFHGMEALLLSLINILLH